MRIKLTLVVILSCFAILSLSLPVLAQGDKDGVVSGQLVNQTKGGGTVAGQDVILTTYLNQQEVEKSPPVKTDAEGKFEFKGLTIGGGYNYGVSVTYQGADYQSDNVSLTSSEPKKLVTLLVWDSTTSNEAIKITATHTVVRPSEGRLSVIEFVLLNNQGDKTYIGKEPIQDKTKTFRFFVPSGARDIQYGGGLMECCVYSTSEGLTDTMPIMPGEKEMVYNYNIEYKGTSYDFKTVLYHPTASYDLLVQGGQFGPTSKLVQEEPTTLNGVSYNRLSAKDLTPGTTLAAELINLPKSSFSLSPMWVVLILAMLTVAFMVAYPKIKRARKPVPVARGKDIEARKRRLLVEIARLDDRYEAGEISEEQYQQLRSARKAQLTELMRQRRPKS